jgi:phosphate:Na+ symporter
MAVFMVGMKTMSHSLEQAAGSKMRKLMGKISNNRLAGVGIGAAVTALMNSSAATTVMLVGFVNVGVISLAQAATIIMGANIGTTISAQIFAFAGEGDGLSVTGVFALIAMVGLVLTLTAKKDKVVQIGNIMIGIGFIFIGLKFLSNAVGQLIANDYWGEKINGMFTMFGNGDTFAVWQMIVLFFLGMVLTAAMQSSAAMTGLVISLAGQGLISINMAIFITLGSNIGTCFTSIIASLGTSVNARRTAILHLTFNVIGCIIFIIPMFFVQEYVSDWLLKISSFGMEMELTSVVQHAVANFHLMFNVLTTAVLLPFTNVLVTIASAIVPDRGEKIPERHSALRFIDKRFLESPPIAVSLVRREILGMANLAFTNYNRSLKMLLEGDFAEKEEFDKTEDTINTLNREITAFCIQLSSKELSVSDEKKISAFFRNVSDLERIGDYAQNITEYAQRLKDEEGKFSPEAVAEIQQTDQNIAVLYANVMHCFEYRDPEVFGKIDETEENIDRLTDNMQSAHLTRLNEGKCTTASGAIYLQLAGNLERIADHMVNIAKSVKSYLVVKPTPHNKQENK